MEQDSPLPLTDENSAPPDTVSTPSSPEAPATSSHSPDEDDDPLGTFIAILLRDGLDHPIADLPVKVDIPGAATIEAKTDSKGAVVVLAPANKERHLTLSVKDEKDKHQEVCKIDPAKCEAAVIVRSPKVKVTPKLQPHQQRPLAAKESSSAASGDAAKKQSGAAEGLWYANILGKAWTWFGQEVHPNDKQAPASPGGAAPQVVKQTVNRNNNPIMAVVGPECPNKDNLRLGGNNIYRSEILNAAKRVGLIPQAVAALIDAEAGNITESIPVLNVDGTPKIYTKGKLKGKPVTTPGNKHWDAQSSNPTGAAGLTQFLVGTWLQHALKPGCFIHEQSAAKGWVKNVPDAQGRPHWSFVLADGKTTNTPWAKSHAGDANIKACLNQRFVPEWSIMAAADYGKANLSLLQDKGFKLQSLNDAEKAKLMYLMHHEGEGAGPLVIRDQLSSLPKGKYPSAEARIKANLIAQLGTDGGVKAEELIKKASGSAGKAYRDWLIRYIDKKIDLSNFSCDSSKNENSTDLKLIFEKI